MKIMNRLSIHQIMRRFLTLFFFVLACAGSLYAQQVSDEQVIKYVKEAQKQGKTQRQMTQELMRMGVTKEQILRIREDYEKQQKEAAEQMKESQEQQATQSRERRNMGTTERQNEKRDLPYATTKKEPTDPNEEKLLPEEEPIEETKKPEEQIFGHNMFQNPRLTFEPSANMATPANYHLGPGDEVIIDIWGASENTIRQIISPEGNIQVSSMGPVHLSGMTVKEANAYLQREFAKIYAGLGGDQPSSQIKLTVGDIRTIQISIMGEVMVPGTYSLSAFATVFHALYMAGGVNDIGTLRQVQVMREGRLLANLDVYEYIMQGKISDDIRLQEGDVIVVNPYQSLVQITGKVKRPMFYEMKPNETLANLLKYCGGFTGDAYKKALRIIRKSGREHQVYNVDEMDYSVFRMEDGDVVSADSVLDRFENKVEIRGAIYRPGLYQMNGTVNSVKQLIKQAEGLRGDAFLSRAILDREKEDLTHEIIQVDVRGLLNGTVADIPLQRNDVLYIPSIHDLQEEQTVTIHGQVADPGTYAFSERLSIEDLIIMAGGLLEDASSVKVEVARRMKDPTSDAFSSTIGQTFSFDLKENLKLGNGDDFHLQPFDEVYVRKSPAYFKQQNVLVSGEVLFSGNYALSQKNERLSDLVAKAGGITPDAYVKGARLTRKRTPEEMRREEDVVRMAQNREGKDSIAVEKLNISETYSVGIDLAKALRSPKSDADLVLREGDELYIPEYINTVKISGAVMYPNTVVYKNGERLMYYINQAGGFGDLARKRRAYVVYLNGTVSRVRKSSASSIEPGCEIIVPSKGEKRRMSTAEIVGIGSSAASLAAVIASLVNLFK